MLFKRSLAALNTALRSALLSNALSVYGNASLSGRIRICVSTMTRARNEIYDPGTTLRLVASAEKRRRASPLTSGDKTKSRLSPSAADLFSCVYIESHELIR
jgi:hypothetical protein